MKAVRIHTTGGPEAMVVDELPIPEPGPGQVRVRVEAAGVNFIDIYQRSGLYPMLVPATLGMEGAGVVEACGPGTEGSFGVAAGTRVAWAKAVGSYATHVVAPVDQLVAVPDGVDPKRAAAAMLQGMTAHYLTRSTFALGPGHTCLVHAAAGGVGLLLCQMARRAGARVIGTVSTEAKAQRAQRAGAGEVIVYTSEDFVAAVKEHTGGKGVDVVYDSVGQSTFAGSLDCLRPRGMLVLYGQSSGPVPAFDPQLLNRKGSLFLTRPSLFHYLRDRAELEERAGAVLGAIAAAALEVTIDRALPLDQAAEAHELLAGRQTIGKLLLEP
jgi:NADPH2:quinone reductase